MPGEPETADWTRRSAHPIAPRAADCRCAAPIRLQRRRGAIRGDALRALLPDRETVSLRPDHHLAASAAELPMSSPVAHRWRCAASYPGAPERLGLGRLAPRQVCWRGAARRSPPASAAYAASARAGEPREPAAPGRAAVQARTRREGTAPHPR